MTILSRTQPVPAHGALGWVGPVAEGAVVTVPLLPLLLAILAHPGSVKRNSQDPDPYSDFRMDSDPEHWWTLKKQQLTQIIFWILNCFKRNIGLDNFKCQTVIRYIENHKGTAKFDFKEIEKNRTRNWNLTRFLGPGILDSDPSSKYWSRSLKNQKKLRLS